MRKSLYLINPDPKNPVFYSASGFGAWGMRRMLISADLAVTTVAALAPKGWNVQICEEHVQDVDFDTPADFIGITGKYTQARRMNYLADEFRRRGKTVIIGGPHASLSPETFRAHCDILVKGELERIAGDFFSDLEQGTWKNEYTGEKADMSESPLPRFDLYPNQDMLLGTLQTSRGCPFSCEFCDVIQYLGRKQRHKPVQDIIRELNHLYEIGYRQIFLADDNLTVYRNRTKETLAAIAEWNRSQKEGSVTFRTQLSLDAADDPELLSLLGKAGLTGAFIGIETPNAESLKETGKRQNLKGSLQDRIDLFLANGITVDGGMIIGFDNDGPDIFDMQFKFAMSTPVPLFNLNALIAPSGTPLLERLSKAGRITAKIDELPPGVSETNIVPLQISEATLRSGIKWLMNQLYSPGNFATRVVHMVNKLGSVRGPQDFKSRPENGIASQTSARAGTLIKTFLRKNEAERQAWNKISSAMAKATHSAPAVISAMVYYVQIRNMMNCEGLWDPAELEKESFLEQTAAAV